MAGNPRTRPTHGVGIPWRAVALDRRGRDGATTFLQGLAELAIAVAGRFTSLQQVLALWLAASLFGIGFASLALGDMGSVAAWVPALLTGFFLWLVRPEEKQVFLDRLAEQIGLAHGLDCRRLIVCTGNALDGVPQVGRAVGVVDSRGDVEPLIRIHCLFALFSLVV